MTGPRPPSAPAARARALPIRSAVLPCEVCGEETPHRLLKVAGGGRGGASVAGLARCSRCHLTHPFEDRAPAASHELWMVLSEGRSSRRERRSLPPTRHVEVDELLEGEDPPLRVRRLEGPGGQDLREALARDVATLWAVVDRGPRLDVSLIEGQRTRATSWVPPEGATVRVGDRLELPEASTFIIGFRGRGRTWRRTGDVLPASEVTRIYARRTVMPPAGRSAWRTDRFRPRSRTSDRSTSSRVRSSPGVRSTRTVPRA